MRPASFEYYAPNSLGEAITLIRDHRESAKVLAGGQSLLPMMAFRLVRPTVLVDLRRIETLSTYRLAGDTLKIGSMVTHRTVELDRLVMSRCAVLEEAIELVGHVAIRNIGTVGGSLAHADPAAEWAAVVLALESQITIFGPDGYRVVEADQFFTGWMSTCLAEDEVLTEITLTLPGDSSGSAFEEVARRHGDFAIVAVAAVVDVTDSVVAGARIALAGAASTPIRARAAESLLLGTSPGVSDLVEVGAAAAAEADPMPDLHGSEDYKRHLVAVLTRRAVRRAYERARGTT